MVQFVFRYPFISIRTFILNIYSPKDTRTIAKAEMEIETPQYIQ